MARFYARFDSGSPNGWTSGYGAGLDVDYFDRLRVGASSASGAGYRNGLITSRSLLSTDIYADLDPKNQDASKGTYFPGDSGPYSTDGSTFVSWSTAYTSSLEGIKTPTTNAYATLSPVNYSKRPTASVLSTSPFVTASSPLDGVGASYTTYTNAVNAVKATLDAIQVGGTALTPFVRSGSFPSRTLHSIWHDPDLTYFAWDDFTPGLPQNFTANTPGNTGTPVEYFYSTNYVTDYNWSSAQSSYEFKNDINAAVILNVSIYTTSSTPGEQGTLIDSVSTTLSAGSYTYTWSTPNPLPVGLNNGGAFYISSSVRYRDQALFTETPSLTSLGAIAGTPYPGTEVLLRRLYTATLRYLSTYSSTCADYTSPTTRYTTSNGALSVGDYIYQTTNTYSPSIVSNGFYYDLSVGQVYEITGGPVESVQSCT